LGNGRLQLSSATWLQVDATENPAAWTVSTDSDMMAPSNKRLDKEHKPLPNPVNLLRGLLLSIAFLTVQTEVAKPFPDLWMLDDTLMIGLNGLPLYIFI